MRRRWSGAFQSSWRIHRQAESIMQPHSPRELAILGLMLLMETLAGFPVILGLALFDATVLGYATYWLVIACAYAGLGVAIGVLSWHPKEPWNRVALLGAGAAIAAGAALAVSDGPVTFLATTFLLSI